MIRPVSTFFGVYILLYAFSVNEQSIDPKVHRPSCFLSVKKQLFFSFLSIYSQNLQKSQKTAFIFIEGTRSLFCWRSLLLKSWLVHLTVLPERQHILKLRVPPSLSCNQCLTLANAPRVQMSEIL